MEKICGAYAKVLINADFTLNELGEKIKNGLEIQNLKIQNEEIEPYDFVIYVETLGFELEIKPNYDKNWSKYNYEFVMTTTDSFQEIAENNMVNLSLWMARYMSLVCDVSTLVLNEDKKCGWSFYRDPISKKRQSNIVSSQEI